MTRITRCALDPLPTLAIAYASRAERRALDRWQPPSLRCLARPHLALPPCAWMGQGGPGLALSGSRAGASVLGVVSPRVSPFRLASHLSRLSGSVGMANKRGAQKIPATPRGAPRSSPVDAGEATRHHQASEQPWPIFSRTLVTRGTHLINLDYFVHNYARHYACVNYTHNYAQFCA